MNEPVEDYLDLTAELLDRRDIGGMTEDVEENYGIRLDALWSAMTVEQRREVDDRLIGVTR